MGGSGVGVGGVTYSESGQNIGPCSDAHANNTLQPVSVHRDTWILLEQQVRKHLEYESEGSV